MPTLHIEHRITDLATWTSAFQSLGEVRRQAGVTAETVRHPHGDDQFIVIDLEFDTSEHAFEFLQFLETQVWAVPANSPALAGSPESRVLERVQTA